MNSSNVVANYDTIWLSKLYALLVFSSPAILPSFTTMFTSEIKVAARILSSGNIKEKYSIVITDDSNKKHSFIVDPDPKQYQSKGNWLWVTQVDLHYLKEPILSINIKKNVIDIPYSGNCINAFWLLKNIERELVAELTQIKVSYF